MSQMNPDALLYTIIVINLSIECRPLRALMRKTFLHFLLVSRFTFSNVLQKFWSRLLKFCWLEMIFVGKI